MITSSYDYKWQFTDNCNMIKKECITRKDEEYYSLLHQKEIAEKQNIQNIIFNRR